MRLLRHPFGINEDDLRRLLERRNRAHNRALAETGARIERLLAANADCRLYLTLLQGELVDLMAEQRTLTQMLQGDIPENDIVQQAARLAAGAERVARTRVESRRLAEGVLRLLRPYLQPDAGDAAMEEFAKGEQQRDGRTAESVQAPAHRESDRRF